MNGEYEAIILPGLRLTPQGEPKPEMLRRVNAALELYRQGRARIVCCGGDTMGLGVSEAQALFKLLAASGVPESDIILEERSKITAQNFENAARILGAGSRVALVTSDYHMLRSRLLARRAGLKVVKRLKAKTPPGRGKSRKRLLEFFGIIDLMCGWQTGSPRPAAVEAVKRRILELFGDT